MATISLRDSTVFIETLPLLCHLSRFDVANRDNCDCSRATATWILGQTNTAAVTNNMFYAKAFARPIILGDAGSC